MRFEQIFLTVLVIQAISLITEAIKKSVKNIYETLEIIKKMKRDYLD